MIEFIDNVKCPHYHYGEAFNREIYNRVTYGGMSRFEAYTSLGYDLNKGNKNRVKQALHRAMQKGKKTFVKDISKYDANVSVEEIIRRYESGEYDKDDVIAHMTAHSVVLEEKYRLDSKKKLLM